MFNLFKRKKKQPSESVSLTVGETYPVRFDYADRFCEPILSTITDIVSKGDTLLIKYTNNYNVSNECTKNDFLKQHSV
jgi:hypothetical protein